MATEIKAYAVLVMQIENKLYEMEFNFPSDSHKNMIFL